MRWEPESEIKASPQGTRAMLNHVKLICKVIDSFIESLNDRAKGSASENSHE